MKVEIKTNQLGDLNRDYSSGLFFKTYVGIINLLVWLL